MAMTTEPVGVIVQARMGSKRLPGKVLEPIGSSSLLALLVARVRRCRLAERVVVATTTSPADEPIAAACERIGVEVFRGSEADVLQRYAACARRFGFGTVVRVTGDNPLTDPDGIDGLLRALAAGRAVYAHNKHPRGYPFGTGAEAIRFAALQELESLAQEPYDREHVTTYLLAHPERFPTAVVDAPEALRADDLFLTVDHPDDLLLLRRLHALRPVTPDGALEGYLRCLHEHPEIAQLNHHRQVGYGAAAQTPHHR